MLHFVMQCLSGQPLPIKLVVNSGRVFHWKSDKADDHAAVAVHGAYVSHAVHDKFFVLVDMYFLPKVVSVVRYRIGLAGSILLPGTIIVWLHSCQRTANTILSDTNAVAC